VRPCQSSSAALDHEGPASYLGDVAEDHAKEPTFEQIISRLEAIAAQLEHGEKPLEESLLLFEEGVGLANRGTHLLDEAERRIATLLDNGSTAPINSEENG
jgi:exodeoxyribonuclease VII small subunit